MAPGFPMKRLIVNADDFGLSEGVNRGIIEGCEAGVILSASLLACGKSFEHAIALSRPHPELGLGVHLCLEEDTPILPPERIPSLVDGDGRFYHRSELLRRLMLTGGIRFDEIRAEFAAQIRRCLDAGIELTHFDGHGHVHVYPGIAPVVAELANEFGIRKCRLPAERLSFIGKSFDPLAYLKKVVVTSFCGRARERFRRAGIQFPDAFFGMVYGGNLSRSRIAHLLSVIPAGETSEMMCHPGHHDAEELAPYRDWDYDWEGELHAITAMAESIREDETIEIISFREFTRE